MTYKDILLHLKQGKYAPVYFLMGEEPYFIDKIIDYIENNILDDVEKSFNLSVFYGKDVDVASIVAAAKRIPVMAERQVIVVKEAQNIKQIELLEKYIQQPISSTILAFAYKYKTIDKRKSFAKTLAKNAVLFESDKLYENKIPDFIQQYVEENSMTISPKASIMLTEFLGNDLNKITNEIDKLLINLPAKAEITAQVVEENIGISKDYNVFELQKAYGQKQHLQVYRIVDYFSKNPKNNPMVVTLGILYGYFVKLLIYHALPDKSAANVASKLGINPYFVKEYEQAAKNYTFNKLVNIIGYLRDYDLKVKGVDNVSMNEGDLLKELSYKILN